MGRKAWMSIVGLLDYDPEVLDGLLNNMPYVELDDDDNTMVQLDGQTLGWNLILELGELEVIYPNPDFMKMAVEQWAAMRYDTWTELMKTMFYDYDPIENYYRREHWTDDFTHGHKEDTDLTHGHKVTMDVDDTTTNYETGYNGSTFGETSKTTFQNDDTETHSGKDTTNVTHSGKDSDVKDGYARGNIGVMSTQQMIEMQRETVRFNMYELIIEEFKERFCIMVY